MYGFPCWASAKLTAAWVAAVGAGAGPNITGEATAGGATATEAARGVRAMPAPVARARAAPRRERRADEDVRVEDVRVEDVRVVVMDDGSPVLREPPTELADGF